MQASRHWRLRRQRYALVGETCPNCSANIFPPRDICPDCGEDARSLHDFSGQGRVHSYTTVFQAPASHQAQAPYTLALVQLEEGPLVTAQLTDLGDRRPEVGMPVEMVTRKLRSDGDHGTLVYGYKFRPVLQAA